MRSTTQSFISMMAIVVLTGCSTAPDDHNDKPSYDLTDTTRFKLVSEQSRSTEYYAIIESIDNGKTVNAVTKEAVIDSNRRYFDMNAQMSQYCIEEKRILDSLETNSAGYTAPVYTITQKIVECPEWKLYKDLFSPNFENAKPKSEQPG